MRITVKEISQTSISLKDVYLLVISSFRQWQENGLDSAVAKYSFEKYLEGVSDACVLVALSEDGKLLGTHTLVFKNPKYCFGKYLAVDPGAKRGGVGEALFKKECELAKANGCEYILEDTAKKAFWSVRWHLKMGYKIIGYNSFSTNNYYSYVFRKQLVPSIKWDNKFYCRIQFYRSYIKTVLTRNRYGQLTSLGKLIVRILK